MSPEEHYAKAEELLELAANDEYPERHFQDRDWLTARAQAHATMALFTPAVSINVQNLKSADEPDKVTGQDFLAALPAAHECFSEYVPPAPDPAEAEKKAERREPDELAKRMALIWEGGWDELEEDDRDYLRCAAEIARAYCASSPGVPAPTETGQWKHRVNGEICVASPASGLPYTIGKFNDHGDFVWHSSSAELPEGFAPFVAAEKEEA